MKEDNKIIKEFGNKFKGEVINNRHLDFFLQKLQEQRAKCKFGARKLAEVIEKRAREECLKTQDEWHKAGWDDGRKELKEDIIKIVKERIKEISNDETIIEDKTNKIMMLERDLILAIGRDIITKIKESK